MTVILLVLMALVGMAAIGRLLARWLTWADGLDAGGNATRTGQGCLGTIGAGDRSGQRVADDRALAAPLRFCRPDFRLPNGDTQIIDLVAWRRRAPKWKD